MIAMILLALGLALSQPVATPPAPAIAPGTIGIEVTGESLPAPAIAAFVDAAGQALATRDFTPLQRVDIGRYIARIVVTRTPRGIVTTRAPAAGGSLALGGSSVGAGVALPSNKIQLRRMIVTELDVRIVRRIDGVEMWRGRALTAQAEGTADDALGPLGRKLMETAMRYYPASLDGVASVP